MPPPLQELRLEWCPPNQLNCSVLVPRQPLASDPATHLEFQLSYNLLEREEGTPNKTGKGITMESDRVLIKMGNRAAEGGGGRLRARAEVPASPMPAVERTGLGLWKVSVRARLLWEKGAKGHYERGPQLESWMVIPCAEVSQGDVSEHIRRGCLEVMQEAAREAQNTEQPSQDMVLKQLLMFWKHVSNGDEAVWLKCCALPEDQAKALLNECLVAPLAKHVDQLQTFLAVGAEPCDRPNFCPAALWESWDSGQKLFDTWRLIASRGEASRSAHGDISAALEQLPKQMEELLAEALRSLDKPVQDPLSCISAEVIKDDPDTELLWRARGEARTALTQWGRFRPRIAALMGDDAGAEAEVANRLYAAVSELRRGLPIAEEVLAKDLESRLEEMHRTLSSIGSTSAENGNHLIHATMVQTSIEYSEALLRPWSQTEPTARPFWTALLAITSMQVREAEGAVAAKEIWPVWGESFHAIDAWETLRSSMAPISVAQGSPVAAATSCHSLRFRSLLSDLSSCLTQLLVVALHVLIRTLSYPLLVVEEEFGADFGKVHIGGYEALQLCMKHQPHIAQMANDTTPACDVGQFMSDMASRLQDHVLEDIRSTSKELEFATADETKEVAELIQALQSLDFDLTRWNFLRPCVAKMATGPGAVGEMMRRLLGLADRVRAARDLKDQQHIRGFTLSSVVAKLAAAVASGTSTLPVANCNGLCQGQEIIVAKEYHQAKSVSPLSLVARTRDDIAMGEEICRLEPCPIIPVDSSSKGWSQAFLDTVENFNSSLQDSADQIVKKHYGWLPTDSKAREIALLTMYTVNSLYCEVNRALYDNDRQRLWDTAGYIRELRQIFLVGQISHIVAPFIGGTVVRSLSLEEDRLEAFAAQYERSQIVCWVSFTSTSRANESNSRHSGNVKLKICCGRMGVPATGQHYPGLVKAFSAFQSEEEEVIFPPHCPFRIVNVLFTEGGLTLEMETLEYPDVWELVKNEDWAKFAEWAAKNSDRIDSRRRKYSMIGTIAESISKSLTPGVPDPFEVCLRHGADVNELHKKQTSIAILEKKLGSAVASDRKVYSDWLSSLRSRGGKC